MENGQSRLRQAQEDVDEVKDLMLANLTKAEERSGKLEDLEDRSNQLFHKSKAFSKTTTKVKQKKQFENMKYKVIIAVVAAVVLIVIIVVVTVSLTGNSTTTSPGNG